MAAPQRHGDWVQAARDNQLAAQIRSTVSDSPAGLTGAAARHSPVAVAPVSGRQLDDIGRQPRLVLGAPSISAGRERCRPGARRRREPRGHPILQLIRSLGAGH